MSYLIDYSMERDILRTMNSWIHQKWEAHVFVSPMGDGRDVSFSIVTTMVFMFQATVSSCFLFRFSWLLVMNQLFLFGARNKSSHRIKSWNDTVSVYANVHIYVYIYIYIISNIYIYIISNIYIYIISNIYIYIMIVYVHKTCFQ